MSTELNNGPPEAVGEPVSHKGIAALLVKHYELHEGLYDLMVEYVIGMGKVGPDPGAPVPGAMVGMNRLSLTKAKVAGPQTVDAAEINPKKVVKTRVRKTA
jgi:hypothetical protein